MMFLHLQRPNWRNFISWSSRRGRVIIITASLLIAVVLWLGGIFFLIWRNAASAKSSFESAQENLLLQQFPQARSDFSNSQKSIARVRMWISLTWPLTDMPPTAFQLSFLRDLVNSTQSLSAAISDLTAVAERIAASIGDPMTASLSTLTVDQKRQILQSVSDSGPGLEKSRSEIHSIITTLNPSRIDHLWSPLRNIVTPLVDRLVFLDQSLSTLAPATKIIPSLAGYPEAKTYLFLLQNNTELRPSGGFIGTYGVLNVANGDVTNFITDNSYNLDDPVKFTLSTTPPEPLKKYNRADRWFFRDSNWSPDFPTSAQKALALYRQEGGSVKNFDGVIAVDPTFIQSLIKLTGPITVQGNTFTADNFVSTLQELVERGYLRQGLPASERKEVVGSLGKILLQRILALPQTKLKDIWTILSRDINERHLLFYSTQPEIEAILENIGWSGQLEKVQYDSLALVDANLASLKTDSVIQRAIRYELAEQNGKLIAKTTITYHHRGSFSNNVTRYRTYLRLYVPPGSVLLSSEGADLGDRSSKPGTVDVSSDLNRTVFGAFKSIEPGTDESISFVYQLPSAVIHDGQYQLFIQKQSGIPSLALTLNLKLPKTIKSFAHLDTLKQSGNNMLTFDRVVKTDLTIKTILTH